MTRPDGLAARDTDFGRHLAAALAAAIGLRLLALFIPVDPFANPDAYSFVDLARSLAENGRLAYVDRGAPGLELRAFRSLLYPVFLAPFLGGPLPGALALGIQGALGVLVVAALALHARRAFGDRIGLVTAWIGAFWTGAILLERQWASEALFTPLLAAGALVAARARTARAGVLAGIAFGLAAWTRPAALAAAAGIVVVYLLARSPRLAACLLAGLLVALAPALARNARVLGAPVLLTSGGMNFWIGNEQGTVGDAWRIMARDLPARGELGMDRWFYDDTRARLPEILRRAPSLLARKLAIYLSPAVREPWYLPWRFLLPLAAVGLVLAARRHQDGRATAILVALLVTQTALALLTVPWPRYRFPMEPFTWPLTALAAVVLWDAGARGRIALVAFGVLQVAAFGFQLARAGWYP